MTGHPGSALRVGDAERDAAVEQLNRHFADGRLTEVEREERAAMALTARTAGELDALLADLPRSDPDTSGSRRRRRRIPRPLAAAVLVAFALFVSVHVVPLLAVVLVAFVLTRVALAGHRVSHHPHRRRW